MDSGYSWMVLMADEDPLGHLTPTILNVGKVVALTSASCFVDPMLNDETALRTLILCEGGVKLYIEGRVPDFLRKTETEIMTFEEAVEKYGQMLKQCAKEIVDECSQSS